MKIELPQNPVFIVGYARSGTTLLQGLLATQPGLLTFPETHYFNVVEKAVTLDSRGSIQPDCLAGIWQILRDKVKISLPLEARRVLQEQAEQGNLNSKILFEALVTEFLTNLHPGFDKEIAYRWLEKTPHHANFIDRILEIYPRAQVLYILRHPVAAIYSRKLRFPFNKNTPVSKLAGAWKTMQHKVAKSREKFPLHIHRLHYEDLVADLEGQLHKIATFLNLDFDFDKFDNFSQGMRTGTQPHETWKQEDSRSPLVNTNDRYGDIIAPTEALEIENIIAEEMIQAGYKPYFS